MPWEISLSSDKVAHTLYTKSGGLPGHTSQLVVSPDLSFAIVAFACGAHPDARALASETESVITPLIQKALREKTREEYAGVYKQNCTKKCSGCGEIVVEVDSEMKITRMRDCEGEDILSRFGASCKKEECLVKLWPAGREGEFRCFRSKRQKLIIGDKSKTKKRDATRRGSRLNLML
jgi:hypothetical protein